MTDMEDRVLSTMKAEGKPMKAGEIAERIGVDKKEVDKAMNGLKKSGAITSPVRCFWEASG